MKIWYGEVKNADRDVIEVYFCKTEEGGLRKIAHFIHEEELKPLIAAEVDDSEEYADERARQEKYKELSTLFSREQYEGMLKAYDEYCFEHAAENPWYHHWELYEVELAD
jgi:hypothetical protein